MSSSGRPVAAAVTTRGDDGSSHELRVGGHCQAAGRQHGVGAGEVRFVVVVLFQVDAVGIIEVELVVVGRQSADAIKAEASVLSLFT
jgi:hypothetical protein